MITTAHCLVGTCGFHIIVKRRERERETRKRQFISYSRVVQLLHSCGPLFKIIRVCGPQSAKNSYFRSKIRCSLKKKKKKGLHLESVSKIPILAQNHSVLQKKITAAASDRQDLCKIDMRHAAREPVVGPRCYRRLPLLMIDKT